MATATRTQSKIRETHVRLPASSDYLEEDDSTRTPPLLTRVSREPEPLEKAQRVQEAPEASQTRRSEAADAGRGEDLPAQERFTRGRSRS